jgi:transcriptional regulator with AAA-type ATPase domain
VRSLLSIYDMGVLHRTRGKGLVAPVAAFLQFDALLPEVLSVARASNLGRPAGFVLVTGTGQVLSLGRKYEQELSAIVRKAKSVLGDGQPSIVPTAAARKAKQTGVPAGVYLPFQVNGKRFVLYCDAEVDETFQLPAVQHDSGVCRVSSVLATFLFPDEARAPEAENGAASASGEVFVGTCPLMQAFWNELLVVAKLPDPVLLVGESGTGKEVFAKRLHELSGRSGELIAVNCGGIPVNLIESELFGHVRGAFSDATQRNGLFRAARAGTLFLDEIGELPLPAQSKLLRVIQDRKVRSVGSDEEELVDVRIVAATNRDVDQEVAHGNFRKDLLHRFGPPLCLPPLAARGDDVLDLADILLAKLSERARFAPCARELIRHYGWPGNVRELEIQIRRALARADGESIAASHFSLRATASQTALVEAKSATTPPLSSPPPIQRTLSYVSPGSHRLRQEKRREFVWWIWPRFARALQALGEPSTDACRTALCTALVVASPDGKNKMGAPPKWLQILRERVLLEPSERGPASDLSLEEARRFSQMVLSTLDRDLTVCSVVSAALTLISGSDEGVAALVNREIAKSMRASQPERPEASVVKTNGASLEELAAGTTSASQGTRRR